MSRTEEPVFMSCPECGGVLRETHDQGLLRFQCTVGHKYSLASLLARQSDVLEEALWAAVNALEQRASLNQRLAERASRHGQITVADRFHLRANDARGRASVIKDALLSDLELVLSPEELDDAVDTGPPFEAAGGN